MSGVAAQPWRWTRRERRDFLRGLVFISPWLIGFAAFLAYPIGASLYYSFTDYDILGKAVNWVGFDNYRRLLYGDEYIGKVLFNTLYFVAYGVPSGLVTAFALAVLLNSNLRFRSLFRTLFYVPAVVPAVASTMVWLWIYNVQYGVINAALRALSLPAIPFLSSQQLVKPSLIVIHCWASGGSMVIFLAALQDVPRSLYDAAIVDGAGWWKRFWHVTIPMISPVILYNLLMGVIGSLQTFARIYVLTGGGPNYASYFYNLFLYENAFSYFKLGLASAQAWILFVVIMLLTLVMLRTSGRWVYYAGAA